MTKKDFELIAAALARCKPSALNTAWYNVVYALADALATTNPRFDRARFLAACGVQS